MTIADGACEVQRGAHQNPDATIIMRASDFVGINEGTVNAVDTFWGGLITIEGSVEAVFALPPEGGTQHERAEKGKHDRKRCPAPVGSLDQGVYQCRNSRHGEECPRHIKRPRLRIAALEHEEHAGKYRDRGDRHVDQED